MGQGGDERRGMMGRDGWGIIGEGKFVKWRGDEERVMGR